MPYNRRVKSNLDTVISVRTSKANRRAYKRAAKRLDFTLSAFMDWAARYAMDTSGRLNANGSQAECEPGAPAAEKAGQEAQEPGLIAVSPGSS